MTKSGWIENEASRDIGTALLQAISNVKAGWVGATYGVDANDVNQYAFVHSSVAGRVRRRAADLAVDAASVGARPTSTVGRGRYLAEDHCPQSRGDPRRGSGV